MAQQIEPKEMCMRLGRQSEDEEMAPCQTPPATGNNIFTSMRSGNVTFSDTVEVVSMQFDTRIAKQKWYQVI